MVAVWPHRRAELTTATLTPFQVTKTETAGDEIGNEASPVGSPRVQGVLPVATLSATDLQGGTFTHTPV